MRWNVLTLLDEMLDEFSRKLGADYYGVADLTNARDYIFKQGKISIEQYPKAISIGILILDTIVDDLPNRFERSVAVNYHNAYKILNLELDLIASRVARTIQKQGYRALPVPASERFDDDRICAVFSHKLAANLAGLGWIGKSCLLITPENGPRVRWTTILTNAPLSATNKPMENQCGNCSECVDICPVKAFTGRCFSTEEDREARYDARKCELYLNNLEKQGKLPVCGLCIQKCPFGK